MQTQTNPVTPEGLILPDFTASRDTVGEGTYKVRIMDSAVGKWDDKDDGAGGVRPGAHWINWTLETFGEEKEANNGRRIWYRTDFTGPFASRIKEFVKAATGTEMGSGPFDRTSLHGRELQVTYGPQKNRPEYMEVKACKAITN